MTVAVGIYIGLVFLLEVEALLSLRGGVRYHRQFRAARARTPGNYTPPVSLIVPCRGVDPGLADNLRAYLGLEYPGLQILFVAGDENDPCVPVVEHVRGETPHVLSRLLFAGSHPGRGQKVHALLHALQFVRAHDEVLAFGDSDGRPHATWLRDLVEGLEESPIGARTGFRWYVPQRGNVGSVLRAVWNGGAATLLGRPNAPFAWGGAMAIRRSTFDECRVAERWSGALSDDFALSDAVHASGRSISFEPRCLTFSYEDCSLRELVDWATRQLRITRVYRPSLWRKGLLFEIASNAAFWTGIGVVVLALMQSGAHIATGVLAALLAAVYATRAAKGWFRWRALTALFPPQAAASRRYASAFVLWNPLSSLVSLVAFVRSALSRDIEWRGFRYRMLSPTQTTVLTNTLER